MKLNVAFVQAALPYARIQGTGPELLTFAIDSRHVKQDDIFIALIGQQVDGHRFIEDAFAHGARGCMIQESFFATMPRKEDYITQGYLLIVVPNTYHALLDLANAWRAHCAIPIVAITGTVGKTSTKELLGSIVSHAGMAYLVTPGNQNTLLSACMNVLRIRPEHQVAIFEVGISKRNEMHSIVSLLKPTYAAITCIGHQHMDGLGSSLQDIAQEKRAIFSCFTAHNIGVINGDQPLLERIAYSHPVIKFGFKTSNQVQARKIQAHGDALSFMLKIYNDKFNVTMPTTHRGQVMNALAASALAYLLKIPTRTIAHALTMPVVVPGRFERLAISQGRGILINDAYNANPESVKSGLLALEQLAAGRPTIFVFGDMLGLGTEAPFWHRQIGRFLDKVPSLVRLILVGTFVQWTKKTAPLGLPVDHVATWQEAVEVLEKYLTPSTIVLVKGSFGMNLGALVNHFVQRETT